MRYFPHGVSILFVITFIILGINPVNRAVWVAEVIPIVIIFLLLVCTFYKFRFSNLAYFLMSIWLFWHTVGGHYTFANVPFDFVNDLLESKRNNFDRVGHFSIGFFAYAMAEFMYRKKYASKALSILFGLFFIMSVACAYEIIEWQYAILEGGEAGIEFLGSQGDIWDAQKDMLCDTLGAIASLVLFYFVFKTKES